MASLPLDSVGVPPAVPLPQGRQRVSRACAPCAASRRKCDGIVPCAYCVKRGIECHLPDVAPKKRGPKKGSKRNNAGLSDTEEHAADPAVLLSENARLKAELEQLKAGSGNGKRSRNASVLSIGAGGPGAVKRKRDGGASSALGAGDASSSLLSAGGTKRRPAKKPRISYVGGKEIRADDDDEEQGDDLFGYDVAAAGPAALGVGAGDDVIDGSASELPIPANQRISKFSSQHPSSSSAAAGAGAGAGSADRAGEYVIDDLRYAVPASSTALALAAAQMRGSSDPVANATAKAALAKAAIGAGAAVGGPVKNLLVSDSAIAEALAALSESDGTSVGQSYPAGHHHHHGSAPHNHNKKNKRRDDLPVYRGHSSASAAGLQPEGGVPPELFRVNNDGLDLAVLDSDKLRLLAASKKKLAAYSSSSSSSSFAAAEKGKVTSVLKTLQMLPPSAHRETSESSTPGSENASSLQSNSGGMTASADAPVTAEDSKSSSRGSDKVSVGTGSLSRAAPSSKTSADAGPAAKASTLTASSLPSASGSLSSSLDRNGKAHGAGNAGSVASSVTSHEETHGHHHHTDPSVGAASSIAVDIKGSVWDPPGPIIPSKEEMAVIDKFFEIFNRVFPAVDEGYYRAALDEARYYVGEEESRDDDGEGSDDDNGAMEVDGSRKRAHGSSSSAQSSAASALSHASGKAKGGIDVPLEESISYRLAIESGAFTEKSADALIAASASSGNSEQKLLREAAALAMAAGAPLSETSAVLTKSISGNNLETSSSSSSSSAMGQEQASACQRARALAARAVKVHKKLNSLQRNSESYGFRVLHFMILSIGAQIQGKPCMAHHQYNLARAYLGPCFTQPSLHLVSALLLMVAITRAVCTEPQQAAIHASLAIRMCDLVEVPPEIRLSTEILAACNTSPCMSMVMAAAEPGTQHATGFGACVEWPSKVASPNTPWYKRLGTLWAFLKLSMMTDFEGVTEDNLDLFIHHMDEAEALRAKHNAHPHLPHAALRCGFLALLHHKFGNEVDTLEYARALVEMAVADPLSAYTFPVVLAIVKLMPLLKSVAERPGAPAATSTLSNRASEWVSSSPAWMMIGPTNPGDASSSSSSSSSSSGSAATKPATGGLSADASSTSNASGASVEASRAALRATLLRAAAKRKVEVIEAARQLNQPADALPLSKADSGHIGKPQRGRGGRNAGAGGGAGGAPNAGGARFDSMEVVRLSAALMPKARKEEVTKPPAGPSGLSSSNALANITMVNGFRIPSGPDALLPLGDDSSSVASSSAAANGANLFTGQLKQPSSQEDDDGDTSILGTRAAAGLRPAGADSQRPALTGALASGALGMPSLPSIPLPGVGGTTDDALLATRGSSASSMGDVGAVPPAASTMGAQASGTARHPAALYFSFAMAPESANAGAAAPVPASIPPPPRLMGLGRSTSAGSVGEAAAEGLQGPGVPVLGGLPAASGPISGDQQVDISSLVQAAFPININFAPGGAAQQQHPQAPQPRLPIGPMLLGAYRAPVSGSVISYGSDIKASPLAFTSGEAAGLPLGGGAGSSSSSSSSSGSPANPDGSAAPQQEQFIDLHVRVPLSSLTTMPPAGTDAAAGGRQFSMQYILDMAAAAAGGAAVRTGSVMSTSPAQRGGDSASVGGGSFNGDAKSISSLPSISRLFPEFEVDPSVLAKM